MSEGSIAAPRHSSPLSFTLTSDSVMASAKAQPLSIESLLQKQKAEKEAAAKVCCSLSRARYDTHDAGA
jgi:hypothetical protein